MPNHVDQRQPGTLYFLSGRVFEYPGNHPMYMPVGAPYLYIGTVSTTPRMRTYRFYCPCGITIWTENIWSMFRSIDG